MQTETSPITQEPALKPLPEDPDTLIPAGVTPLYTGIAEQTHTRWRHEGKGPPFVRLGRRVFYRSGDLRDWIRKNVRQNTTVTG